jgi:aspartyl-tRNA(Asn)/glutamyl-tRNA(Gln) amidotransferase subunit B
MTKYVPTIGLEIHAELKTRTKMFCDSRNDPDEKEPNKNICPVCTGQPGTLPVINKEAVKHVLKIGLAVKGEAADFSEFDRKNYFYPDIPKGYQISQYKYPLVKGGMLNGISITRIHLEEDTAKSFHKENEDYSLIDFNRAGLPLMELVTDPVIKGAKEASDFAKEFQLLLQYLGAGEANLEKGEMRVEANVSVGSDGILGTKVEVKNLNSFKSVEKSINFEVERQTKLLKSGEKVVQETRGWDEIKEETFSQRTKEHSHDYRYFPDPDLPKLHISKIPELNTEILSKKLPELPWERRERYKSFGLQEDQTKFLVSNRKFGDFFDQAIGLVKQEKQIKILANYITSDLAGFNQEGLGKLTASQMVKLSQMIFSGGISSRGAKDILKIMYDQGGEPEKIAKDKNLMQRSDGAELDGIVQDVIKNNPKAVLEFKGGKESVLQYLVGQGMKESGSAANPEVLKKIIISKIENQRN